MRARRNHADRGEDLLSADEMVAQAAAVDQYVRRLPPVPEADRPRLLIFDSLTPEQVAHLEGLGYSVRMLITMPRSTSAQWDEYIKALMQAATDGTVVLTKSREEGLKFELSSRGIGSGGKALTDNQQRKEERPPIDTLLNWAPSRHSYAEEKTALTPTQIQELRNKALGPQG